MVSLPTIEVGYMVATHACKEFIWLKRLCSDIGIKQGAMIVYYDGQSAIYLAKKPTFHARIKHIDVQYHFVKDMVEDGRVNLIKVETLMNVADSLTKTMSTKKIRWYSDSMGVWPLAINLLC